MNKPNGYDEVQSNGDYTPINLGGHLAIIKRVKETTSKSGKPMIQIGIDFDKGDAQADYFMNAFQKDTRPDKKWPFQGTHYILTEDQDGKCSRSFKGFITSVQDSNGETVAWGNMFENWFTGKKVGVVYGEVEEEYNGEIKVRRRIRYFCSYGKALEAGIPNKKILETFTPAVGKDNGFMPVPDGVEGDIPF